MSAHGIWLESFQDSLSWGFFIWDSPKMIKIFVVWRCLNTSAWEVSSKATYFPASKASVFNCDAAWGNVTHIRSQDAWDQWNMKGMWIKEYIPEYQLINCFNYLQLLPPKWSLVWTAMDSKPREMSWHAQLPIVQVSGKGTEVPYLQAMAHNTMPGCMCSLKFGLKIWALKTQTSLVLSNNVFYSILTILSYLFYPIYFILSIYLFIYLSMYLCIYVSMYLCIYVSMYLCLCGCVCVCLSGWLASCLPVCLSICLSVYLSVYLSICLSVCLCIHVCL